MRKALILSSVVVLILSLLFQFNQIEKYPLVNAEGRSFEKAIVVSIEQDNLQPDGSRSGNQIITVKMTSGPYKGTCVKATSFDGYLFGATCEIGTKVIVIQSVYGEIVNTTVYCYDRGLALGLFAAIFSAIVVLVGGKKGLKALVALLVTVIMVIFFYLPWIYRGCSPIFGAVIVAVVSTLFTMYMIGGMSAKTVSATRGTVMGVITAAAFSLRFGAMCKISGYNVPEIESLTLLRQIKGIKIGELLFSGIIISALGAVMDVAMSIASAVNEIHEKNPHLGFRQLFSSGMTVGRDTMGTMVNTLILAMAGGSLSSFVLIYAYDYPSLQLINSTELLLELMQGLSGSLGIVLAVPIVSAVSSWLFLRPRNTNK